MTTINDKLGLKRAGKRTMMHLPKNRIDAAKINQDEFRVALVDKLKWMIVGSGPEPRALDDQRAMLNWLEGAIAALDRDPDGLDATILRALWDGVFDMTVRDGEVRFRLTAQGHELANNALLNDAEMRHYYQSLAKGAAVDEPKDPQ